MRLSGPQRFKRSLLASMVLCPFGFYYWGAEQTTSGISFFGRARRQVPFSEIAGPAQLTKIFGFLVVTFSLKDTSELKVAGLKPDEAASFTSASNAALCRHVAQQFDAAEQELRTLSRAVEHLERPQRYPSACLLAPFLDRATKVLEAFPEMIPEGSLAHQQQSLLSTVSAFHKAPEHARNAAIKTFIDAELEEMKEFFDKTESNPLTPEQRLAVVTDEDATLVLAGAGSGKTSVIVAKAAYLIERGIRPPAEILLMAFGKDAALEMATRIQQRSGVSVDSLTFHALGYAIIREVEGTAPALAPHASDEAQFRTLLREILINDIAQKPKLGRLLLKWFWEFYWPYKSEWDFRTRDEYYQYVEAHELRTLKGDLVKSFEECEIANWLYLNGIDYEYEPDYEHKLPENDRRAYTPDFRLTKSGVYIEHFGVRKSSRPRGSTRLTTAPFVDRESYLEGIAWKREVHRKYGTILIETYSYERVEGRLTEALRDKLAPYVTPKPIPPEQVLDTMREMGQVDAFTQTLGTFLRHFKSSGATIEQCRVRGESSEDTPRSLAFIEIFDPLFEAYQRRLGKRIDFEDMILRAAEHVESGRYQSPYRHLLVDEFQDISAGRARLLRAMKAQHSDARILVVGDDWQSIYRFTGSDIHLMRDFGAEFGGTFAGAQGVHSTVDLGRTFRSVDKIALPARRFVLQNPSQIEKTVVTVSSAVAPAIKVAYYSHAQDGVALKTALEEISYDTTGSTSVLLLGRYHHIEPKNLHELTSSHPTLSIRFMTVHASKGLEADHVVILRASAERMGFPSEIVDDPILGLVLPEPEQFDHAEERRLFYVALTRARKSVTVLADREKPSSFARELVDHPEYEAILLGEPDIAAHRCSACGGRMLAQTPKNKRVYYACEHRHLCGHTLLPCSSCGKDIPLKNAASPEKLVCSCGAQFPACPDCCDGWLVERKGPYGRFLGCVRYPECKGTLQIPEPKGAKSHR
jgi:DNA helicase IV